ncbi:MAG: peptidylprolyl isomerase [Planctomycetota bacterium]
MSRDVKCDQIKLTIPLAIASISLALVACGCSVVDLGGRRPVMPIIDDERNPLVVIETTRGSMTAELDERDMPNAVSYFIYLVENSEAYNGRPVYMADPKAVYAGPQRKPLGFTIQHERAGHSHKRGDLSIKGDADGTLTADVLIMRGNSADLDELHTVIGEIVDGSRTLDRLKQGDVIHRIYVKRKKGHDYAPTVRSDGPVRTGEF